MQKLETSSSLLELEKDAKPRVDFSRLPASGATRL